MLVTRCSIILLQISALAKALRNESGAQYAAAPLVDYTKLLKNVNTQRLASQLPPLAESSKYQQLQQAQGWIVYTDDM